VLITAHITVLLTVLHSALNLSLYSSPRSSLYSHGHHYLLYSLYSLSALLQYCTHSTHSTHSNHSTHSTHTLLTQLTLQTLPILPTYSLYSLDFALTALLAYSDLSPPQGRFQSAQLSPSSCQCSFSHKHEHGGGTVMSTVTTAVMTEIEQCGDRHDDRSTPRSGHSQALCCLDVIPFLPRVRFLSDSKVDSAVDLFAPVVCSW
jgi:hypothetical protein